MNKYKIYLKKKRPKIEPLFNIYNFKIIEQ